MKAVEILRRRVNAILRERGIIPAEFARLAEHSAPWANDFLKGKKGVPLDGVDRIARALDTSVSDLFRLDDDRSDHSAASRDVPDAAEIDSFLRHARGLYERLARRPAGATSAAADGAGPNHSHPTSSPPPEARFVGSIAEQIYERSSLAGRRELEELLLARLRQATPEAPTMALPTENAAPSSQSSPDAQSHRRRRQRR